MKKLLAIVLVLALSSLANALTISVSGPAVLSNSLAGDFPLVISDPCGVGLTECDLEVLLYDHGTTDVTTLATITDVTFLHTNGNPAYNYNGLIDSNTEFACGTDGDALDGLFAVEITAADTGIGTVDVVLSYVYCSDINWDEYGPAAGLLLLGTTFDVVPEPLTLSLLTLGLAIIRRRH